jgi:hypothetical protein
MSAAWKALELRICRALGGRRAGPLGASVSDCVGIPWAAEIKRCAAPGPPVYARWIQQARAQAQREGKPWLVIVAGHNARRYTVTLDFVEFLQLAQQAGRIPVGGKEESEQRADHATARAFDAAEAQPTAGPPQNTRKTR